MSFYKIRKIWNPSLFQGIGKKKRYFEGWYFKHVSPAGKVYSIIPGIAIGTGKHAFIQTIDGETAETHYITFPYNEFSYHKDRFEVSIGSNRFSTEGISVQLAETGFSFQAELYYHDTRGLPFSLFNPNAMGWYSFVPFMECYHGLVSMDHRLTGTICINGTDTPYDDGRGYIEKDWGRSFPSSWVWMQSNSFRNSGDSFMLSIARIPWLGSHFIGFLGFLSISGVIYKFATYTGAVIRELQFSEDEVKVEIRSGRYDFHVRGRKRKKGFLQAPVDGVMERRITESIDAEILVEMKNGAGELMFKDTGRYGGLEIVGDPGELTH